MCSLSSNMQDSPRSPTPLAILGCHSMIDQDVVEKLILKLSMAISLDKENLIGSKPYDKAWIEKGHHWSCLMD